MALKKGTVDKKIYEAIVAAEAGESGETSTGAALRTATNASAARTAIGAGVGNVTMVSAPANAAATGSVNQIAFDATHIYVCVAANTWVRATLATW